MVFSYTPKSDLFCVDHKLVILVSVVNGLEPEDLLKTKVFIKTIRVYRNLNIYMICLYLIPIYKKNICMYIVYLYFIFILQINLRLILVSGKTKEFIFSPNDSAGDIAQAIFDNWPEGKTFFP